MHQVEKLRDRIEAAGERHGGHPVFAGLAAAFTLENRWHWERLQNQHNAVVMPALAKLAAAVARLGPAAPASQQLALGRGYILASQMPEAVVALRAAAAAGAGGGAAAATAMHILYCMDRQEGGAQLQTAAATLRRGLKAFPANPVSQEMAQARWTMPSQWLTDAHVWAAAVAPAARGMAGG